MYIPTLFGVVVVGVVVVVVGVVVVLGGNPGLLSTLCINPGSLVLKHCTISYAS